MKTKSSNGSSPGTVGKTVLEIARVTALSGKAKQGEKDVAAIHFLQDAGFGKIKCDYQRAEGEKIGNSIFLLEYDSSSPANKKPCRLIAVRGNESRIVDEGLTDFAPIDPSGQSTTEIDFVGARMRQWEVHCKVADPKVVGIHGMKVLKNEILPPKAMDLSIPPEAKIIPASSPTKPTPSPVFRATTPAPPRLSPTRAVEPAPPAAPPRIQLDPPPKLVVTLNPPPRVITPTAPPSVNGVGEEAINIPVGEIVCFQKQVADPSFSGQPRKVFAERPLKKLIKSIDKQGQLVPGMVCPYTGDLPGIKWELISGERRWRSLKELGRPFFFAIVKHPRDKKQQHMLALIENLHREDPNPIELSNAFQEQIDAGATQTSLAEDTSMSTTQVKKLLSIQTLHPDLKPLLMPEVEEKERIRLSEAAALARLDSGEQVRIWNDAKTQPSRRLILAKIHELGRPFIQYKIAQRKDRRVEAHEVTTRINRRINTLSLALIELSGITPEEWAQFAALRGIGQLPEDLGRFTEFKLSIDAIKGKISRAKATLRASASPVVSNSNGTHA